MRWICLRLSYSLESIFCKSNSPNKYYGNQLLPENFFLRESPKMHIYLNLCCLSRNYIYRFSRHTDISKWWLIEDKEAEHANKYEGEMIPLGSAGSEGQCGEGGPRSLDPHGTTLPCSERESSAYHLLETPHLFFCVSERIEKWRSSSWSKEKFTSKRISGKYDLSSMGVSVCSCDLWLNCQEASLFLLQKKACANSLLRDTEWDVWEWVGLRKVWCCVYTRTVERASLIMIMKLGCQLEFQVSLSSLHPRKRQLWFSFAVVLGT